MWEEYEQCQTPEALLVKDLDKFEVGEIILSFVNVCSPHLHAL